ncbi:MAG: hypothetical protein M3N51_09740 [Actinomycetota bacterium]|nr:hypothetical protein [Actinomycetota bacterium]
MGKLVVAPSIKALEGIAYVLLSASQEEFVDNIERARQLEIEPQAIQSFIAANSWRERVGTIRELVERTP